MLGIRKPSLRFYRHVMRATHSFPQDTFVVDNRPENVLAAMSLGMRGTSSTTNVSRALTSLTGNPVKRGLESLQRNAGPFHCATQDGTIIDENYTALLILDATQYEYV